MYSDSTRADILRLMMRGESLSAICRQPGMPTRETVCAWLREDAEFSDGYARALLVRADVKFEELDDVSEDAAKATSAVKVAGLRLKADNIKWQLARMNASKYGDKTVTEVNGDINLKHAIGLQPETARLLASLSGGPDNPGAASPVPN